MKCIGRQRSPDMERCQRDPIGHLIDAPDLSGSGVPVALCGGDSMRLGARIRTLVLLLSLLMIASPYASAQTDVDVSGSPVAERDVQTPS